MLINGGVKAVIKAGNSFLDVEKQPLPATEENPFPITENVVEGS